MFQNRAAAHEQLEDFEAGLRDCNESLRLNNKYGKSYNRRCKILRRLVERLDKDKAKDLDERIGHLRQALEDVSVLALLDGFQQDQLLLVDDILKQLGSSLAVVTSRSREPIMPSNYTIVQYFSSFIEDPLFDNVGDSKYSEAVKCFKSKEFSKIIPLCDEEIESSGSQSKKAKLLKATFLILTKQLPKALDLLSDVIKESTVEEDKKLLINALVKRASLYIQQCQDPKNDAILSFADFDKAADIDNENADVFFNRGQINLLMDKFDAAKDDLEKAAKLRPDFALANVQNLYTNFLAAQMKMMRQNWKKLVKASRSLLINTQNVLKLMPFTQKFSRRQESSKKQMICTRKA